MAAKQNDEVVVRYVYVPRIYGEAPRTYDDIIRNYRAKKYDSFYQTQTLMDKGAMEGWDCYAINPLGLAKLVIR